MPDDAHALPGLTPHASRLTAAESPLLRLIRDLDRWGSLFLETARRKEIPAVEQILGGLVEWMGSDLLDGWLRLPIPLFEEVSDLSEELFRACQVYLAWIRQARHPIPAEARRPHEEVIRGVLQRVQALADPSGGEPQSS